MANGRFAPSPTGELHLGNLRTALVAWLLARSSTSQFVLRMEDLDPATSSVVHRRGQERDLAAIGLDWDGPVVLQSTRLALYDAAIRRLIDRDITYPCFCTRREIAEAAQAPHEHLPEGAYAGTCRGLTAAQVSKRTEAGRPAALRLRADEERITFVDRWCGEVTGLVDDVVLRRNDGMPAYNLAVVVDDADQGVEEVVRAEDLLLSTPRQILIGRLLGLPAVSYAHVGMVLGATGSRLAKRDGAVTLADLDAAGRSAGWVLSLLGQSLGLAAANELLDTAALLQRFDPSSVSRGPWTIDPAFLRG